MTAGSFFSKLAAKQRNVKGPKVQIGEGFPPIESLKVGRGRRKAMKAGNEIESIQNGNKNFCLKPVSLFREPFIFANPAFALPRRVVSVTGAEVDESFCFFLSKNSEENFEDRCEKISFFLPFFLRRSPHLIFYRDVCGKTVFSYSLF